MRFDIPLFLLMLTLLTVGPVAGESNSDNTLVVGEMFDITSDALDPVEDGSVLAEKALITEPLPFVCGERLCKSRLDIDNLF